MSYNVPPPARLAEQFERLPGIGHKTAQRLAFHILSLSDEQAAEFAQSIIQAKQKIHYCSVCQNLTDEDICTICRDTKRDRSTICIVEDFRDVVAIERTHEYNGQYHVLQGTISPVDGIGPEQIRIKELLARLNDETVKELIMATNPTVEGEATAMYISRLTRPLGIKVTRLAYGIPVGGDLEYADEVTLSRALEGRNII